MLLASGSESCSPMFEDNGLCHDEMDEDGDCSGNVGDDHGNKEYPFITSPKVLGIMRKLYDHHKKQLIHDFVQCTPEYEMCPKGSYMTKECKPSTPGPFHSCPILHESGDDFYSLPIPQRKCPRLKIHSGFLSRRQKKQRLNHSTGSHAWSGSTGLSGSKSKRDLLNNTEPTEQHILDGEEDDEELPCFSELCYGHSSWADLKELIDPFKKSQNYQGGDGNKKQNSKRKPKPNVKPVVNSRYRNVTRRRSRHNINAMHVRFNNDTNSEEATTTAGDGPKNPFPMPDIFEEIYFGQMPECLNSLPVSLQNFKKIQMKMAGDNNGNNIIAASDGNKIVVSPRQLEPPRVSPADGEIASSNNSTNKNMNPNSKTTATIPTGITKFDSTPKTPMSMSMRKLSQSQSHLLTIGIVSTTGAGGAKVTSGFGSGSGSGRSNFTNENTIINPNTESIDNRAGIGSNYSEALSKKIDKTAEDAIKKLNRTKKRSLVSRKATSHNSRTIYSAGSGFNTGSGSGSGSRSGKKKSIILPAIRKSQRGKTALALLIPSNHHRSLNRKHKSLATIPRNSISDVERLWKRTKIMHRVREKQNQTKSKLQDQNSGSDSQKTQGQGQKGGHNSSKDILSENNTLALRQGQGQCMHEEVNNNFHDDSGKFNAVKYRQSLMQFIESKANEISENGAAPASASVATAAVAVIPSVSVSIFGGDYDEVSGILGDNPGSSEISKGKLANSNKGYHLRHRHLSPGGSLLKSPTIADVVSDVKMHKLLSKQNRRHKHRPKTSEHDELLKPILPPTVTIYKRANEIHVTGSNSCSTVPVPAYTPDFRGQIQSQSQSKSHNYVSPRSGAFVNSNNSTTFFDFNANNNNHNANALTVDVPAPFSTEGTSTSSNVNVLFNPNSNRNARAATALALTESLLETSASRYKMPSSFSGRRLYNKFVGASVKLLPAPSPESKPGPGSGFGQLSERDSFNNGVHTSTSRTRRAQSRMWKINWMN